MYNRYIRFALVIFLILILFFVAPFSTPAHRTIRDVVEKTRQGSWVWSSKMQDAERDWEYRRALTYEGTGERVRTFLDKARSGRPFTVAVIGGSVSKGRGLTPPAPQRRREPETPRPAPTWLADAPKNAALLPDSDDASDPESAPISAGKSDAVLGATTLYSHENLHVQIFDFLNKTFPHPENRLVNGAQGGVGAGYFGWCFKEHIPVDPDLVLLELGINDLIQLEVIESYEHLVRSILQLDSRPAIINIETFTLLFSSKLSSSSLHGDVVTYYDIPTISLRDVLLPRLTDDPDEEMPRWFRTGETVVEGDSKVIVWGGVPVDMMHLSALGHALAAGLAIRYLTEQIHQRSKSNFGRFSAGRLRDPIELDVSDIPPTPLTSPFEPLVSMSLREPHCRSLNSARLHLQVMQGAEDPTLPPVAGLRMAHGSHGWEPWQWKEKRYLVAHEVGARVSIEFIAPSPYTGLPTIAPEEDFETFSTDLPIRRQEAEGSNTVGISFQQSATFGLGSVYCWVDDDVDNGSRVDGWWPIKERNMGSVAEVASGLVPGPHVLHCEVMEETLDPGGGHEFRLIAVMYD